MTTKHTHQTKEEIKACMLAFKECWTNPPKSPRERESYCNKPHGTPAKDKIINY